VRVGREQVMTALFALLETAADFQTTGRRVRLWSDIAAQPALFLSNVGDEYQRRDQQPARVTMHCEARVFVTAGADEAPGTMLNTLVDAIDAVMVPDNLLTNRMTLGGLVWHCWIEGEVEYYPGDLKGQAAAIIPIRILVP
jgi:hypothetical protein